MLYKLNLKSNSSEDDLILLIEYTKQETPDIEVSEVSENYNFGKLSYYQLCDLRDKLNSKIRKIENSRYNTFLNDGNMEEYIYD